MEVDVACGWMDEEVEVEGEAESKSGRPLLA